MKKSINNIPGQIKGSVTQFGQSFPSRGPSSVPSIHSNELRQKPHPGISTQPPHCDTESLNMKQLTEKTHIS